jgi:hypothetical protein
MKPQMSIPSMLLILGTVAACHSETRGLRSGTEYEYERSPDRLNQGGADTGGGAGTHGRMLESYQVHIHETPEFQNFVQPLIEEIAVNAPAFAAELMHIALHRQWYVIPTDLGKIPPSDMVTAISGTSVEQIAVQTEAEVWIDKRAYVPMPNRERRELIVHELVMGVRLMEYQSAYDQCLAQAAGFVVKKDRKAYREKKRACSIERLKDVSTNFALIKKKISLNNGDYDTVRRITLELLNNASSLSAEELNTWALIDLRRGLHRSTTD